MIDRASYLNLANSSCIVSMSFCHHGFDSTIVTLLLQVMLNGPMTCAIDGAGICFPVMARKTAGSGNMIITLKDLLRNEECLGSIIGLPISHHRPAR
jgi:hypothetical protein